MITLESPVWAVVRMIGMQTEELNSTGIHRLENSLTLCSGLFEYFNRLTLWLQAVVFILNSSAEINFLTPLRRTNRTPMWLCPLPRQH